MLNVAIISAISGIITKYSRADVVLNAEEGEYCYPTEVLNSLPRTTSLPDHILWLKNGYIFMSL